MAADTLTDTGRRPTKTQALTLAALAYEGFCGEDGWKPQHAVRRSAEVLGSDHGEWYSRLASLVSFGWAEKRKAQHLGYKEWRITPAGREALARHEAGDRRG